MIFTALGMGVLLACLLVLDIANLVWQKREIQKIADLAAVAGASETLEESCSNSANSMADINAVANGKHASDAINMRTGVWEPASNTAVESFFNPTSPEKHNACDVQISRTVPYLFLFSGRAETPRTIHARATAFASLEPLATVAIRSTLASVNDGALNALLRAATGSSIALDAVSWKGLAKANVNLLGVFDSLIDADIGLADYQSVLSSDIQIASLIKAMIGAIEPNQLLASDIQIIQNLANLNWGSAVIRLGEIIKLENVRPEAALNMGVNALDLLQGALQLAAKDQAIGLNIDILQLLKVKLKIVEPAQIAVVGNPNDDNVVIEARTAQMRLWAALGTSSNPSSSILKQLVDFLVDLLTAILKLIVDIRVLPELKNMDSLNLDLLIDVGRGYVKLEDAQCSQTQRKVYTTFEKSSVDIYLGQIAGTNLAQRESKAFGPWIPTVTPLTILEIGRRVCVLGICGGKEEGYFGRIRLGNHLKINALSGSELFEGDDINKFEDSEADDEARVYHRILNKNLSPISSLLQGADLLKVEINAGLNASQETSVVNLLLQNILTPVLNILNPLGKMIDGLLNVLGVNLNAVEVAPYLNCGGKSELVY